MIINDTKTKAEKKGWRCLDCGKDTFIDDKDYYMVKHDIWEKIGAPKLGMLCMDCLETRLEHKLRKEEILLCSLTEIFNPYTKQILNSK